jgi:hypothetical protein
MDENPYATQQAELTAGNPYQHYRPKNAYKRVRAWSDFYRTSAIQGMGARPGEAATDPLSRLRQTLQQPGWMQQGQFGAGGTNLAQVIGAQQQAARNVLQQRAAGMGVQGAYAGVLGQQERTRQALIERSQAAYEPMRYQAETQYLDQQRAALAALSQNETDMSTSMLMAGRSV